MGSRLRCICIIVFGICSTGVENDEQYSINNLLKILGFGILLVGCMLLHEFGQSGHLPHVWGLMAPHHLFKLVSIFTYYRSSDDFLSLGFWIMEIGCSEPEL